MQLGLHCVVSLRSWSRLKCNGGRQIRLWSPCGLRRRALRSLSRLWGRAGELNSALRASGARIQERPFPKKDTP